MLVFYSKSNKLKNKIYVLDSVTNRLTNKILCFICKKYNF